MGNHLTY